MAETVSLTIPESGEMVTAAQERMRLAACFTVDSPEAYMEAEELRQDCQRHIQQGEALFKEATAQANAVHKRLVALLKAATEPWAQAAQMLRRRMIAWDEDQKAIQRRRQAEEDAKAKAEAEKEQRELAETMRELGLEQQAAEVEREAPIVQAPIVPRETESAIKYRTNWTFEIECLTCRAWFKYGNLNLHENHAIQAGNIPALYLMPDWKKIAANVRANKSLCQIPGIRVIEEKV